MTKTKKHDENFYVLVFLGIIVFISLVFYILKAITTSQDDVRDSSNDNKIEVSRYEVESEVPTSVPAKPQSNSGTRKEASKSQSSDRSSTGGSASSGSHTGASNSNDAGAFIASEQNINGLSITAEEPSEMDKKIAQLDDKERFLSRLDEIVEGTHDKRNLIADVAEMTFSERSRTRKLTFSFGDNVTKVVAHLPSNLIETDDVVVRMIRKGHSATVFVVEPTNFEDESTVTLIKDKKPEPGRYQVFIYAMDAKAVLLAKGLFVIAGT